MTCLICHISNVCACCFVRDGRSGQNGICLLCAGAPCSMERRIEIEEARERLGKITVSSNRDMEL